MTRNNLLTRLKVNHQKNVLNVCIVTLKFSKYAVNKSNFLNLRSSQYLPSYPISHTQVVSPLTESGLQVPLLRQGLIPQGAIKH